MLTHRTQNMCHPIETLKYHIQNIKREYHTCMYTLHCYYMYSCTVTDQYNYTSMHHNTLLYQPPQVIKK